MSPDAKPDAERGFEEIRREVIESRNLVIKTDNQIKNLHAELKQVSKRQDDALRRTWVATGVAYLLFVSLCVAGAVGISAARTASAGAERDRLAKDLADAKAQLDAVKADREVAEKLQHSAGELLRRLSTGSAEERLEAADGLSKLDSERLSTLERQALAERVDAARREASAAALDHGKAAYRRQDYAAAAKDLGRAVALHAADGEALETSFMLGAALAQTRRPDEAISPLKRFITEDRHAKTRDLALLYLAQAYEQTSQFDKAAEAAREALSTYPNSELTAQLKSRLASAKRGLAGAAAAEPAAAPPAAEAPRQPLRAPVTAPSEAAHPPSAAPGAAAHAATPAAPPAAAPAPAQPAAVPKPAAQ